MILTVYAVLLILAIVAVALGFTLGEPYFSFVGLFFFFNLGLLLMTGALEIPTGETTVTLYAYDNGTLTNTTETTSAVYTEFSAASAHWYGFLLALASGFGAFILLWNVRNGYEKKKEAER